MEGRVELGISHGALVCYIVLERLNIMSGLVAQLVKRLPRTLLKKQCDSPTSKFKSTNEQFHYYVLIITASLK